MIEALVSGIKIISTDCESGPSEILEDGKLGTLVPVNDSVALANAIISTLDNKIDYNIDNNNKFDKYSINSVSKKYMNFFNKMQINKVSIIIPCFNEKETILILLDKVNNFKNITKKLL